MALMLTACTTQEDKNEPYVISGDSITPLSNYLKLEHSNRANDLYYAGIGLLSWSSQVIDDPDQSLEYKLRSKRCFERSSQLGHVRAKEALAYLESQESASSEIKRHRPLE